jgi:hypothetical protein
LHALDPAIAAVLARGLRAANIKSPGCTAVSTSDMGTAIVGGDAEARVALIFCLLLSCQEQ